jgi:membrane dipeptidase
VLALLALAMTAAADDPELLSRARELTRSALVVDTHIDVPYRLRNGEEDLSERTAGGDFDYPRAMAGGLDVAFFSIFVPAALQGSGNEAAHADRLIELVESFAARWPARFAVVRSAADARALADRPGVVGLALGMENGAPIADLAALDRYAERGIRYVTLAHGENNHIADSSYAEEPQWHGLSPFGRELVAAMNRRGVMIDVSHVSDETFWQVMELSRAPVIASHSSCRSFTPDWQRNMSDEMIQALAARGGVVQINFGSAFLTPEANAQAQAFRREAMAFLEEHGLTQDAPEAQAFEERWFAEHPRIYADVTDVASHIQHVIEIAGVDHVGLGSDFDGVGDSLPTGLKDVSQYPNLVAELLRRGLSEETIRKILGENLLRVWEAVERVAAAAGDHGP